MKKVIILITVGASFLGLMSVAKADGEAKFLTRPIVTLKTTNGEGRVIICKGDGC